MASAVIATSDPRASEAGAAILANGGNAIDAAVTAALVLLVVEPHACGIGGDAFLLLKDGDQPPVALDGSGSVPAALAAEGSDENFVPIPLTGPRTITVPGALSLFEHVLQTYGTINLESASAAAIELARDGFEVRPTLAAACERARGELAEDQLLSRLYLPNAQPLRAGQICMNPSIANSLEHFATYGADDFYRGELADAISKRCHEVGAYLTFDDLQMHETTAMTPVATAFAGTEVWELPSPTQGPAVLASLAELERTGQFDSHAIVDALLYGLPHAGINLMAMQAPPSGASETTYIAVIDSAGRGASLITSVFSDFGSVVGVEAIGGPLQNRAAGISLIGQRPRPGKPPHTIIPAMVTENGKLRDVLGVVGGYMQAQGQVQILVKLIAHGMSAQAAIDAPRFRLLPGGQLALEPGHDLATSDPDGVGRPPGPGGFGGAQVASIRGDAVDGGADQRRGGAAIFV